MPIQGLKWRFLARFQKYLMKWWFLLKSRLNRKIERFKYELLSLKRLRSHFLKMNACD
jgi:hypothetical protein